MTQLKYVDLLLKRDSALHIPETVGAWEVPILEAVFPEVEVKREFLITRDAPVVEDEFARLSNRYGRSENEDGSKGLPFVEAVYGQHGIGHNRLKAAIEAATVSPETNVDDLMHATAALFRG